MMTWHTLLLLSQVYTTTSSFEFASSRHIDHQPPAAQPNIKRCAALLTYSLNAREPCICHFVSKACCGLSSQKPTWLPGGRYTSVETRVSKPAYLTCCVRKTGKVGVLVTQVRAGWPGTRWVQECMWENYGVNADATFHCCLIYFLNYSVSSSPFQLIYILPPASTSAAGQC